jgi:hypothetical protein
LPRSVAAPGRPGGGAVAASAPGRGAVDPAVRDAAREAAVAAVPAKVLRQPLFEAVQTSRPRGCRIATQPRRQIAVHRVPAATQLAGNPLGSQPKPATAPSPPPHPAPAWPLPAVLFPRGEPCPPNIACNSSSFPEGSVPDVVRGGSFHVADTLSVRR